jgi:hypothetical protein
VRDDGLFVEDKAKALFARLALKNAALKCVSKDVLRDRTLLTDKFEINLGHALGTIDPKDNIVRKQFRMDVRRRSTSL